MQYRTVTMSILMLLMFVLAGCTDDGGDDTTDGDGDDVTPQAHTGAGPHNLVAYLQDGEHQGFDQLWITFTAVHVRGDGDWLTVWEGEETLDILGVSEQGDRALLGGTTVEPGQYIGVRLDVSDARGIRSDDFRDVTIDVADGQAAADSRFEVAANGTTELLIALDLDRSFAEQRGGVQDTHKYGVPDWTLALAISSVEATER